MNKNLVLIALGAVAVVGAILALLIFAFKQKAPDPEVDKIVIWGVWDESEVYDSFITEFKKTHKNVKEIEYKKFACNKSECLDYMEQVTQGLAAGSGPDIFMINNTWVPAHKDKMISLDSVNDELTKKEKPKIMNLREYGDAFFPVAKKDLTFKDADGVERIYGFPLYMDNLAVFYNRDLFSLAGMSPPPNNWTWQEFENKILSFDAYVQKTTLIDDMGNIKKSGAAIGYGKNVSRAPDILAVLMMQMGSPIVNEDWESVMDSQSASADGNSFSPGEAALDFFTKFSDRNQAFYCWNKEMHHSIDAFTANEVGMMMNYSNQIEIIKKKAPNINFGIAPLPQISNESKAVNFASYWAFAVSKQATGQKAIEAFNFLKFLTEKAQAAKYAEATGRVSARMDLAEAQKEDQWLGVFADQAISATSFRQANNARIGVILENAINSIVDKGVPPAEASQSASQLISQEGYNIAQKLGGSNFNYDYK